MDLSANIASLAAALMGPQGAPGGVGNTGVQGPSGFDNMKRRYATQASARPSPQGHGTPVANSIIQARQAAAANPFQSQNENLGGYGTGQLAPQQQRDIDPERQALEQARLQALQGGIVPPPAPSGEGMPGQAREGVQIIRGAGHTAYINAHGQEYGDLPQQAPDTSGMMDVAGNRNPVTYQQTQNPEVVAAQAAAKQNAAGAKGQPTWKDLQAADKFQYEDLRHQYDHIQGLASRAETKGDKANYQKQLNDLRGQMTPLATRLSDPKAIENYQAGIREMGADKDVAEASKHLGPEPKQAGAGYQETPQQGLERHLASLGVPKAQKAGTLASPNLMAIVLKEANGNPAQARAWFQQLGYAIPPHPGQQPAPTPGQIVGAGARNAVYSSSDLSPAPTEAQLRDLYK